LAVGPGLQKQEKATTRAVFASCSAASERRWSGPSVRHRAAVGRFRFSQAHKDRIVGKRRVATAAQSTSLAQEEVAAAGERAIERQGLPNQALAGLALDQCLHADPSALKFLNIAATRLGWSARSTHRAPRVARTIADLAGAAEVTVVPVAEAVQYRRALRQCV